MTCFLIREYTVLPRKELIRQEPPGKFKASVKEHHQMVVRPLVVPGVLQSMEDNSPKPLETAQEAIIWVFFGALGRNTLRGEVLEFQL